MNFPNLLSCSRLIAAPIMLFLAWRESQLGFIIAVSYIFATDFLDGWIARRYNLVSDFGASLDSIADIFFYLLLIPSLYFLWPAEFAQAQWFVIIGTLSLLVPFLICLIKFKMLPSFHTWSAKLAAVLLAPVIILWLGYGITLAPKMFSAYVVLVAIEHSLIIVRLKHWTSNVRSIFNT